MIVGKLLDISPTHSAARLESLSELHEMVCRLIRGHYPMNEVPPELVGHLRFLGDQVRQIQKQYGDFLATELPAVREGALA